MFSMIIPGERVDWDVDLQDVAGRIEEGTFEGSHARPGSKIMIIIALSTKIQVFCFKFQISKPIQTAHFECTY